MRSLTRLLGCRVVDVRRVDAGGVAVLGELFLLELFVVATRVVVRIWTSHNGSRRARCRAARLPAPTNSLREKRQSGRGWAIADDGDVVDEQDALHEVELRQTVLVEVMPAKIVHRHHQTA